MPVCPRCGTENPDSRERCLACGSSLAIAEADTRPLAPVQSTGPADARSKTPFIIASCAILACLLVALAAGGIAAAGYLARDSLTSLSPFARPAVAPKPPVSASATSTPTPARTPTASPVSTLKLGNETLQVKQMLIAEDFDNDSRGWKVERVEGLYMYVDGGQYHAEVRGKNVGENSLIDVPDATPTDDFALLVNVRTEPGPKRDDLALLFGDRKSSQFYQLDISDNGNFLVSYWGPKGGGKADWDRLTTWKGTRVIKPQGEWNTLAIVRRGVTLSFYLNGTQLHSAQDSHQVPLSQVGIYAGAYDEPVVASFDKLYLAALR